MTSLLRRLLRILRQDRIRLPRRPLVPCDLRPGDRLQIGLEIWRVSRAWPPSGFREGRFALTAEEASVPAAELAAPDAGRGARSSAWVLIKGGDSVEVPVEMIVVFPSGPVTSHRMKGSRS